MVNRDLAPDEPAPTKAPRPSRRSAIPAFIVMDVMEAAAGAAAAPGADVIHMEVGQPGNARAPRAAHCRRRSSALERETLGYTMALGSAGLRERIARHYREATVTVASERVVVTTDPRPASCWPSWRCSTSAPTVALPSPGYPSLSPHPDGAPAKTPVPAWTTDAISRWMPTAASGRGGGAAKGWPGSCLRAPPTRRARCWRRHGWLELAAVCRAQGLWLVSDEIYMA